MHGITAKTNAIDFDAVELYEVLMDKTFEDFDFIGKRFQRLVVFHGNLTQKHRHTQTRVNCCIINQ